MHAFSRPALLTALLAFGSACGSKEFTPTPSTTSGEPSQGAAGGSSGSTGSGSSGSTGSTGSTGSSGSSGSSGGVVCQAGGSTGTQHQLTVGWTFPNGASCVALGGAVTRIEIQVSGANNFIEYGCDGNSNQVGPAGVLVPGTWAVSVRGTDNARNVKYSAVQPIVMADNDKTIFLSLAPGDITTANKVCGLPR